VNALVARSSVVLGVLTGAIMVPALPAAAAPATCTIPDGSYSCATGYVPTSTRIGIVVWGTQNNDPVTCTAYDTDGIEVGAVTNADPDVAATGNFTVPRDKHFLVCVRPVASGGGKGRLYEDYVFTIFE
jgi:hypothetical protein